MRVRAGDVAAATGGRLVGDDVVVEGVSIDSRAVLPGSLFVPLVADRDGHDFVADALAAGAVAHLTEREPMGRTAIVVADTRRALTELGVFARGRLPDRVVGITGSVGKTTVKDLLAAALRRRFRTAASERSFNNELGVPLTLANAPDDAEAVVVELGARGVGHIAALCEVARPTVGVVTAVGHVHTELFGTIEEVARGKGELVEALPATGVAVLNGDDPLVRGMAQRTRASVVLFGVTGDVRAESVVLGDDLRASFTLRSPEGSVDVHLGARGPHQVGNALAAAAAALALGVDPADVAAGLAVPPSSPWRMELHRAPSGAVVLNDAYNANPLSMAAALHSLAAIPADRRVAVLGTMAELGAVADEEHRAVAALAGELGIRLLAVAEPRYGGEQASDLDDAKARLGSLGEGDAVLVKGSRVAGLERLAEALLR